MFKSDLVLLLTNDTLNAMIKASALLGDLTSRLFKSSLLSTLTRPDLSKSRLGVVNSVIYDSIASIICITVY